MIDKQFKIQPVSAFYRLLANSIVHLFIISIILSVIVFFIIKFSVTSILDPEGLTELAALIETQSTSSSDIMAQSHAMKKFITDHPSIVPFMMFSGCIILFTLGYLLYATQLFIKNKITVTGYTIFRGLTPNSSFLKIFLYLILTSGTLMFISVFIMLSISRSPVLGILISLFLGILIVRTSLFVPGVIIGEMNFAEAFKYSFDTISLGRGFKILVFGFILFFMLTFLISLLFYFPALWFQSVSAQIYLKFLLLYIQTGLISIGLASLFLRYGAFEEEKIAE